MIFAFISSSYSWVWPVAASIGGLILLWGLWMEEGEEKVWFSSTGDFTRQKLKAKIGRYAVMFGVAVEIGVGFALAAKDEIEEAKIASQIALTNTNLDKIDPLNLPIASVSAKVVLLEHGTNSTGLNPANFGGFFLFIGRLNNLGHRSDVVLTCSDLVELPGLGQGQYTVWHLDFKENVMSSHPNSLVRIANEWDMIELDVGSIPSGTEILGGDIKVAINSTIKAFTIPTQTAGRMGTDLDFSKKRILPVTVLGR